MSVSASPALARDGEALPANDQLQVVYRPIGEIRPYGNNPREHPRHQLAKLKKSIARDDVVQPLIIDEQGEIIAGHAVFLAAKSLGFTQLPTVTLYGLTETDKRRLRIALNKLGDLSKFNAEILKGEMLAILADEPELDVQELGFEVAEIDLVIHADADIDDDRIPDPPGEPRAQLGDIWNLGDHVIGCGDARDANFLRRVLGDVLADAAFLDIPYNVSIAGHATRSGQHGEFAMASGEMSDDEFVRFVGEALRPAKDCTRDGGVHFICIDHHHVDQLMTAAQSIYGARLHICVWNKSNAGMGSLYRSKHEFVAVYRVGSAQPMNNVQLGRYGRSRTSVWDYPSVNMVGTSRAAELKLHPTVKPVALVADAIKDVTKPGDVVLDTFLGSGTTLIAAERTGRSCRAIEIDPHYVDIAIERWIAITGGEPELVHRQQAEPLAVVTPLSGGWGSANG
jgi:DNA modification methylase